MLAIKLLFIKHFGCEYEGSCFAENIVFVHL